MTAEGDNSYCYTFDNVTKINMMFVTNGTQSAEQQETAASGGTKTEDGL